MLRMGKSRFTTIINWQVHVLKIKINKIGEFQLSIRYLNENLPNCLFGNQQFLTV